jgi:hypothetical protein
MNLAWLCTRASGEGSGEGVRGFGAEPCQVQQGSGEGFRRRFKEALVQSQVRFNKVLEKVPEKVPEKIMGAFGVESNEVQ